MELEIDLGAAAASARLVAPADLGSFKVVVVGGGAPIGDRVEALGVARVDEHAWVRVDALRELAGPHATPEWEASFAAMLEFARSRGWLDEELEAVRGHVERRASAGVE